MAVARTGFGVLRTFLPGTYLAVDRGIEEQHRAGPASVVEQEQLV